MEIINKRIQHEIEHGKKLANEGAEDVWNWSSPAGNKRADHRASILARVGKIKPYDRVLEIGCGTDLFTRKIHKLTGANILATDMSEPLLKIARKDFPQGNFQIEDAMNMSFPGNSFDVVC